MTGEEIKEIVKEQMDKERHLPTPVPSAPVASLPELSVDDAVGLYEKMNSFVKKAMTEDKDFGKIPGTPKPTLYKPGAEKLMKLFGMEFRGHEDIEIIDNWEKPFFYRRRLYRLWRGDRLVAEAVASINSYETRYRWRWVKEADVPSDYDISELKTRKSSIGEWGWAYEKRETSGQYGKPEEYWKRFDKAIEDGTIIRKNKPQHWKGGERAPWLEIEDVDYRIPNDDIFTIVNTLDKMVDKRGLVAVVLIGCNASEFFTQDVEDIALDTEPDDRTASDATESDVVEGDFTEAEAQSNEPSKSLESRLADMQALIDGGDQPSPNAVLDTSKEMGFEVAYFGEVRDAHTKGRDRDWGAIFSQLYSEWQEKQ